MGQCKSKVQVLDESDRERRAEESRLKKANKRRWRKSKGYSLSASLEGNLDLGEAAGRKSEEFKRSDAAVLLSYNVREERKRIGRNGVKKEAGETLAAGSLPPPGSWAGEEDVYYDVEEEDGEDPMLLAVSDCSTTVRSGRSGTIRSDRSAPVRSDSCATTRSDSCATTRSDRSVTARSDRSTTARSDRSATARSDIIADAFTQEVTDRQLGLLGSRASRGSSTSSPRGSWRPVDKLRLVPAPSFAFEPPPAAGM